MEQREPLKHLNEFMDNFGLFKSFTILRLFLDSIDGRNERRIYLAFASLVYGYTSKEFIYGMDHNIYFNASLKTMLEAKPEVAFYNLTTRRLMIPDQAVILYKFWKKVEDLINFLCKNSVVTVAIFCTVASLIFSIYIIIKHTN